MMGIHLSPEREKVVRSFLEDGPYCSEDEVIGEALRLLQERDDQSKLTHLRQEIAIGTEQADRGELEPFDPHATLARIQSRQATRVDPS